jgi:DNA-binding transcriptional LysR family regulator
MKPSLDDLYIFAEIALAGGLIRGAKRLGLPKSTVSRRLAQLERDVGAKLIDRDARHFEMTEAGRAYADQAERLVEAYTQAQEVLARHDAKPRGVLKVAMPADFAISFLGDALASFTQRYPSVTLDIEASPQLVDIVGERFDLAIRMGKLPDSSLIAKPLARLPRHFYAARSLLKQYGTPQSMEELQALPFISLQTQAASMATLRVPLINSKAMFEPRTVIKTNSIGLTRTLAAAGAGAVILPDVMADGLVRVLDSAEPIPAEAHFVFPQRPTVPAKTRAFVEHLIEACEQRSPSTKRK